MLDWMNEGSTATEQDPANSTSAMVNDPYSDMYEAPWVNQTNVYLMKENYGDDYRLYLSIDYSQDDLLSMLQVRYGTNNQTIIALFRVRVFGNG
jgi:hypothetical protein